MQNVHQNISMETMKDMCRSVISNVSTDGLAPVKVVEHLQAL